MAKVHEKIAKHFMNSNKRTFPYADKLLKKEKEKVAKKMSQVQRIKFNAKANS